MRLKYKLSALALVVVLAAGCGDLFELDDFLDNPNEALPETAGPDFVLNSVQLEAVDTWLDMHFAVDGLVRHADLSAYTYLQANPAVNFDGLWINAYANFLPDAQLMRTLGEDRDGLDVYVAIADILEAYILVGLVDLFGDIPYSQALQGTEVISPGVDPGEDVYAAAESLLDGAIQRLENTEDVGPSNDQFYGGDKASWITLANTIKLKIGITTRLVGGASKVQEILDGGDFIDDPSEDFIFKSSTERLNPDSRHPFYADAYEALDGTYMQTYFMWLLNGEKGEGMQDPRIRHYFYRQTDNSTELEANVYECFYSDLPDPAFTPDHFTDVDPDMPYCVLEGGYYGRDHGNGGGIPPDGQFRTVYGLFPGGGKWDNNSYEFTQNLGTDGALGEGDAPLITSYMVHLWLAEAVAAGDLSGDALDLLKTGVEQQLDYVRSFESRIPQTDLDFVIGTNPNTGEDITAGESLILPDSVWNAYVQTVEDRYNNESDKLDVIMKEMMIALYGNSYEMYNAYRRTGRPLNMQPGLDLAIGQFPRSLLYPAINVNLNANVEQKPDLQQLVFWDDGSADLR